MAMELTHVRFARDLKDRLGVTDEAAYYAGDLPRFEIHETVDGQTNRIAHL